MIRAGLFAAIATAALAGCAEAPMTAASGRADGAETGAETGAAPETLQCYGERICEAAGRRFCADAQKCSRSGGRTVLR
jgi:hypothetical protein